MKVQVVGVQKFNFKNSDGNFVAGSKLHYLSSNPSVIGSACNTVSVMDGSGIDVSKVVPEGIYNFDFDQRGRLTGIFSIK